jgi:hypothetical protein
MIIAGGVIVFAYLVIQGLDEVAHLERGMIELRLPLVQAHICGVKPILASPLKSICRQTATSALPTPATTVQAHRSPSLPGDWAISRGRRRRVCAAQLKTNCQSTFSSPRSFTWRSGPVCFSHPKLFSIQRISGRDDPSMRQEAC